MRPRQRQGSDPAQADPQIRLPGSMNTGQETPRRRRLPTLAGPGLLRPGLPVVSIGPMSRTWVSLGIALAVLAGAGPGCKVKDPPPITAEWRDDFERRSIGGDYYKTGGGYAIADGALSAKGSYNHPLWLRKKLPRDVIIELDTWSNTPDGDIKVEVFGDGSSHAENKGQYTSTGYVLVMGGWNNSKSLLARGNEHGQQLVERTTPRVQPGKRYHWKIRRQGKRIDWWVDDMETPFLSYEDPRPLEGAGHRYFGFNNWESDSWFDNLVITPL